MSLPFHEHIILSGVVKLLLVWNGILKVPTSPLESISHFSFSYSSFSSQLNKSIFFYMVLCVNGIIPTTFRYKMSWFSGEGQEKLQIGDSCGNSEFVTAILLPFGLCLLNANKWKYTGFGECLCHQLLWNINNRGIGHLNWGAWWQFRALFVSFGRCDDLFNHRDVYFIVMGG